MLMLAAPTPARAAADPPANDAFASPVVLTGESVVRDVTTTGATSEPGEAAVLPGAGASVWFQWTAPANTIVSINACEADFTPVLGVFVGSGLANLSRIDSGCTASFGTGGSPLTVRIAVAGENGETGTARLTINPPAANDDFAAAKQLDPLDGVLYDYGSTQFSTREAGEPDHADGGGAHSLWYRWTATRTSQVTIDTCSYPGFDTTLSVYTGTSLAQLQPVMQNDDSSACLASPKGSSVSFLAEAGREYRIAVDGHGPSASGTFTLTLHGPPLNDDFADAREMSARSGHYNTTEGASKEPGEPNHGGDAGGHSVWFKWTATRSRTVTLSLCFAAFDPLYAVYTGNAVNALTPVATTAPAPSDDCTGGGQTTFQAVAGTTYRIALDGKAGASGTYSLDFPPANDDFAGAVAVNTISDYENYESLARASREPGEPDHGGIGRSAWLTYRSETTQTVTLDTCLSDTPTVLAVYTGTSVGALTKITGSTTPGSYCSAGSSGVGVTFTAQAQTTYRIAIDARTAALGAYWLRFATAPVNDAFAAARELTGTTISGTTRGATKETGEPTHAGIPGGHSVWYRWTAPSTGSMTLDACGDDQIYSGYVDTVLAVYEGDELGSLTQLAANDNGPASCANGNPQASSVTFPTVAGKQYRIAVDGAFGHAGSFRLVFPAAPVNDAFATATTLTGQFVNITAANAGATKEAGEPAHAGDAGGRSVWYQWTAPTTSRYVLDTCNASFDTLLAVYFGSAVGALAEIGRSDDAVACGVGSTRSSVTFSATAGTSYRFAIDGKNGASGSIPLTLATVAGNDDFATPYSLTANTYSTRGASRQAGEPDHAGKPGSASVWFVFFANATGPVTISTCPAGGFTSYDTVLAVYKGSTLATLDPVVSNDDSEACGAGSKRSLVTFTATAGTSYRVAVDSRDGVTGSLSMDLDAKPGNDDFASATTPASEGSLLSGSTRSATRQADEPAHAGDSASGTVWYRWIAPTTGPATFDTCTLPGLRTDTIIAVYSGTSLGALTPEASNDDTAGCGDGTQSRVTFPASAGREYRIAVAGKGLGGPFYLQLTAVPANDAFATPRGLGSIAPAFNGSNRSATKEAGEPSHAGNAGGHSLWFSFLASNSGTVTIDACNSLIDTVLAVYTGTALNALEPVTTGDDECGTQSRVRFPAVAGTVYRIALDGKNGAIGSVSLTLGQAPVNDAFGDAIELLPNPPVAIAENGYATAEAGEPAHAGQPATRSVWWRWTPEQDVRVTIQVCQSSSALNPVLAVYTGTALNALTPVDQAGRTSECRLSLAAKAGTTYRIAVDAKSGGGTFGLAIVFPPDNDDFANARFASPYGSSYGTNDAATVQAGEPDHAGIAGGHSVWYRWTATQTGTTTLSTCGSNTTFDTLLAVYTGTAVGALQSVAFDDDGCGTGSRLTFTAVAGTEYRFVVDGKAGAVGSFYLRLTPRPDNDDFAEAPGIGRMSLDASNENATAQAGEPQHAGQVGGRSVWYAWTANRSGDVRIAICKAEFDTLLAVYRGSALGSLTEVARNDDSDRCGAGATRSALTFAATAGTRYLIAVDGKAGAQGAFTLQFDQPANDNFADAETLTGRETSVSGDGSAAGAEAGEPDHGLFIPASRSVWYRWTAPIDGAYTFSTCTSSTRLALYRGASLATLTPATVTGGFSPTCASSYTIQATAGTEYRIAVDGYEFNLTVVGPPANDAFADARDLGSNLSIGSERNTNASRETEEVASAAHSVWYRWTAPRTGETTIDTCSLADFDAVLSVFTGTSLAALTPIASGDGCGASRVTFPAVAGTEYRIAVDGLAGATGRFGLRFEVPPANDAFAAAEPLTGSVTGTNAHASSEPGEPQHAGVGGGRSVWYRWTAAAASRVIVDTCGSALDTVLGVYAGASVNALTQIDANDDSLACAPGVPGSRVVFDATAGASYAFAIDGKAGAAGTFVLRVTLVPVNDDFDRATAIATDADFVPGDTRGASLESGEPAHGGRSGLVSVWYRWTAPVNGTVRLDACGPDREIAVYTGSAVSALTAVSGSGCRVSFEAVAGTAYRIAVATPADATSSFTLALTRPPANDRFAAATRVTSAAAVVSGTLDLAGREPGEPVALTRSVWYRWTAPTSGRVRIAGCGAGTPSVYTGTDVAALTLVAAGTTGRCGSLATFDAVAGTDYAIAVDGAQTTFKLAINGPANDDFEDAAVLTGAAASGRASTLAATAQAGEPAHWNGATGSVWWKWTAPSSGTFAVSTCGSSFDTVLAIYRGTSLAGLTSLAANDTGGSCGTGSRATFTATAGTTYAFAVDGRLDTLRGEVSLTLNAPTNDLFSAPVNVTGASVNGTNVGASVENGEPLHGGAGGASVWFTWTAPASGIERVSACGATGFEPMVAVYTGSSLGSLTRAASATGDCSATFNTVGGTTYRIAVDGRDAATGTFALAFERISPANDAFASATALTGAAPVASQGTAGASAETGEPAHAGVAAARSVWFRWTAPASATIQFDTCDSDFDTRIAVYRGSSLGALQTVGGDDDGCGGGRSRVRLPVTAGQEYRIAVDGAAAGSLVLRVNRPFNDPYGEPEPVPEARVVTGTTVGATRQPDEPGSSAQTVWYRWSAPADGPVSVAVTCPGGAQVLLAVFDAGAQAQRLSAQGCNGAGSTRARGTFTAVAGSAYLIAVGHATAVAGGTFVLRVGVPANDDFADAAVLSGTHVDVNASTVAASVETGDPLSATGASLWWAWTAPASGSVSVDVCGSAMTPGVYTGSAVGALTAVGTRNGCTITFAATQGTRYIVGAGGSAGDFALHLDAATDTTPPDTSITNGPAERINTADATFAFASTESGSTFECSLDGAAFAACVTPHAVHGLGEREHTLQVRAIDPAGNVDATPATHTFTVDRTAPNTTITADPAPYTSQPSVAIAFDASETSTYACSWDGGAFAPCGSPFTRSGLADKQYTFSVRAIDAAGNVDPTPATTSFFVDAAAPETSISGDPPHDVSARPLAVAFGASKTGVTFACSLDGATAAPCTSPHTLSGLTDGAHRFTVVGTDRAGHVDATPAEYLFVVDGSPLTARAGDDRTVLRNTAVDFDASASRPVGGIESYVWDFGDGATATGVRASHAYANAGNYTAKLTVTGASGSSSATVRVRVLAPAGSVSVTVRDTGGAVLAGADVLVMLPNGGRVQSATGPDGVARLYGLADGSYTAYVQAAGHVPATTELTVSNGEANAAATLRPGPVAAATLSVHRMTLAQILAAGINPNDPANQNAFEFTTRLSYGGVDYNRTCIVASGGWVNCGGGSGSNGLPPGWSGRAYYPDPDGEPTIVWMAMEGEARWLKEFFSVDLIVQNLAPGGFTFTGGQARLNLPDGLSLAPTSAAQSLTKTVADIGGNTSRAVNWKIRGDREGFYNLSVDYSATMAPFNTRVVLRGETASPFRVWGLSALQLVIDTDDEAKDLHPQTMRVGLKNVSDVPVYNASLELKGDPSNGIVMQPRQQSEYATKSIPAGGTFWAGPYVLVGQVTGQIGGTGDLNLSRSFVRRVAGDANETATIIKHPRVPAIDATPKVRVLEPPLGDEIALSWDPIPGATQYQVYRTKNLSDGFPAEPWMTTTKTSFVLDSDAFDDDYLAVSSVVNGELRMRHAVLGHVLRTTTPSCDDPEQPYDGFRWNAPARTNTPANCSVIDGPTTVSWTVVSDNGPVTMRLAGDERVRLWDCENTTATNGTTHSATARCTIAGPRTGSNATLQVMADDGFGTSVRTYRVAVDFLGYVFENDGMSNGFARDAHLKREDVLPDSAIREIFKEEQAVEERDDLWELADAGTCYGMALSGARFDAEIVPLRSPSLGRSDDLWDLADESLLPPPNGDTRPVYTKELLRRLMMDMVSQRSWDATYDKVKQYGQFVDSKDTAKSVYDTFNRVMALGKWRDSDFGTSGPANTGLAVVTIHWAKNWWALPDEHFGHAVVAHGLRRESDGTTLIDVWDNNYPGETKTIEVEKDGTVRYAPSEIDGKFSGTGSKHVEIAALPLYEARGLLYRSKDGSDTAIADVPASTHLEAGADANIMPVLAGGREYAGVSAFYRSQRATMRLVGDQPRATVRGEHVVANVKRASGTGELQTTFDLAAGSLQATGGPVTLTIDRDGRRYTSTGASKLTVAPDGSVDSVPDGTGARVEVTGPSGVVQSYVPTVQAQPSPTPDPGATPTPTPTPVPPTGGGGTTPPPLKPALGGFSAAKSVKASALAKGLKLTLKGAVKGATVKVRVRELKGAKPGKQVATATMKAKGKATEAITVKVSKTAARKLAGKRLLVEVTATLKGAATVTRTVQVAVKR
ncbi:carboxypeptidase family protein [Solirubrobacter pauli]|uniref:alpha-amylase n=1 Tax=Solirubrobacter pauli TaxID=166793 RepID=A0A660L1L0_9ACTN|nr:PKD domain-containing protein [Solirubrobacter pauli]RKQ87756.1 carboxypeptidase family protein [Solirubrobacter pauli]